MIKILGWLLFTVVLILSVIIGSIFYLYRFKQNDAAYGFMLLSNIKPLEKFIDFLIK